jgi:hypothetical protein
VVTPATIGRTICVAGWTARIRPPVSVTNPIKVAREIANVWCEYQASEPFDIVCLTRSPEYTPADADPIFDAIVERFIDEAALHWRQRRP